MIRRISGWVMLSMLASFLTIACEPPAPPDLEIPPCLDKVEPAKDKVLPRKNAVFTLTFSKLMEPETVSDSTIYLVKGAFNNTFLNDLESPPILESRLVFLVPLDIKLTEVDHKGKKVTQATVTAKKTLQGDSNYNLVITRKAKDKLIELTEYRRTGLRPLNRCADEHGIWKGSVDQYKSGESVIIAYNTEPEPPRPGEPSIVEVMATPSQSNGEYVEVMNISAKESLDLCGLYLSDGTSSPRELIAFGGGGSCKKIPPGGLAIILEPDYPKASNPYKIPTSIPWITTKGSSSTLLSAGISSGETVSLLNGSELMTSASPGLLAGGTWPTSKSLEKCDPKVKDSKWAESPGTPGQKNTATCP